MLKKVLSSKAFSRCSLPNRTYAPKEPKEQLADKVRLIIMERELTQTKAAALLNTSQSEISSFMAGSTKNISEGRLMEWLVTLGNNIEVVITPVKNPGKISVIVNNPKPRIS